MEKIQIDGEIWTALRIELSNMILSQVYINDKLNKQFPTSKILYHYTSLNGLASIIESQSIFCTNIYFLNDTKEYKYGVSLIMNVIEKLRQSKFNAKILKTVESNANSFYKKERFATCFSKSGDMLSQWRAYSNNGKGVSIGFDSSYFEYSIDQHTNGKHIEYDELIQFNMIEELFKLILSFFNSRKHLFDWSNYKYETLVADVIIDFVGDIISSFKHPSFIEEQEYRVEYSIDGIMIKKHDEEILIRTTDTLIIPYIKLKSEYRQYLDDKKVGKYDDFGAEPTFVIRQLPINEIIIGPALDYESTSRGIEELLLKNQYTETKILKSKIPYRI